LSAALTTVQQVCTQLARNYRNAEQLADVDITNLERNLGPVGPQLGGFR
jgi:hypothetical protein